MMRRCAWSRWVLRGFGVSGLIAVMSPATHAQRTHRFMLDAGVGQINWLSPGNWGTTVSGQGRLFESRRFALVAGLRGTFNLATPGTGLTRRDNVATGLVGVEATALMRKSSAVFLSASGAWSRYTARYSGPNAPLVASGPVSGMTWPSGILGVRAELFRDRRAGVSVRADIRPRGGSSGSLNPTFGLGLAF
jgi:hypothetical protein